MTMTATEIMRAGVQEMPMLFERDDVTINDPRYVGRVFTVRRVKQSKAVIFPKGVPSDRGLDVPMTALVKTGTRSDGPLEVVEASVAGERSPEPGVVVRLVRGYKTYKVGDLCVVAKVNSSTTTVHRLGGDRPGERGVNFTPNCFKPVDLSEILAASI